MSMKILSDDSGSEPTLPASSSVAPTRIWSNRIADRILRTYLVLWAFFFLVGLGWERLYLSAAGDLATPRLTRCALNDAAITLVVAGLLAIRLGRTHRVLLANMGISLFKIVITFGIVAYALAATTWGLRV